VFELEAIARTARGDRVYLVQVTAVARSASAEEITAQVGVRVGSDRYVESVTIRDTYAARLLAWAENPSTGSPWRVRDAFTGVVEGGGSGEMRLTAIWWDVSPRRAESLSVSGPHRHRGVPEDPIREACRRDAVRVVGEAGALRRKTSAGGCPSTTRGELNGHLRPRVVDRPQWRDDAGRPGVRSDSAIPRRRAPRLLPT
jgi:hypothetical protein